MTAGGFSKQMAHTGTAGEAEVERELGSEVDETGVVEEEEGIDVDDDEVEESEEEGGDDDEEGPAGMGGRRESTTLKRSLSAGWEGNWAARAGERMAKSARMSGSEWATASTK